MLLLPSTIKKNKKPKNGKTIPPSVSIAKKYFSALDALNKTTDQVTREVFRMANEGYTASYIFDWIDREKPRIDSQYRANAQSISSQFTESSSNYNREKMEENFKKSFGVDTATILDDQATRDLLALKTKQNVNLIKTIPQQYFTKIENWVIQSYTGQLGEQSLDQVLATVNGNNTARAAFIARDQTSKLNGALTQIRHQGLGIKKYKWKNSQDQRVVGNPSGLYPKGNKGHGDHWHRENKVYAYDNPPSDGNPGHAYNCRCTAEPIIDLDDMSVTYI